MCVKRMSSRSALSHLTHINIIPYVRTMLCMHFLICIEERQQRVTSHEESYFEGNIVYFPARAFSFEEMW